MQAPAPEDISASSGKPNAKLSAYLRLLRPRQWTKNLIAYAPLVFAAKAQVPQLFQNASLCVLSFCLLSSSIYIINDILDRKADSLHPTKCKRPIASGEIPVSAALVLALILAPLSLFIAFSVRGSLVLVLLAYLGLTISYSLVLKHVAILDVLSIAGGFLLRAVAGAVAVRVPMSGWFLLCTGLGAVFLALEKRRRELIVMRGAAESHRKALQAYSTALLDRMEALILPSLLTSYVFYSFLSVHGQWMMLSVPFVIYGLMRYQQLSCSEDSQTGTPEDVLLKDRPIQLAILFWLLTSASVVYGGIQYLAHLLVNISDSFAR